MILLLLCNISTLPDKAEEFTTVVGVEVWAIGILLLVLELATQQSVGEKCKQYFYKAFEQTKKSSAEREKLRYKVNGAIIKKFQTKKYEEATLNQR